MQLTPRSLQHASTRFPDCDNHAPLTYNIERYVPIMYAPKVRSEGAIDVDSQCFQKNFGVKCLRHLSGWRHRQS